MQVLASLLFLFTFTDAYCVYSQSHWLSSASEPWPVTTETLCGVPWQTLMRINTSQVKNIGAVYWIIDFHQLCTAVLNLHSEETTTSAVLPSSVALATTIVADSMARWCDNMSGWVEETRRDTVLAGHLYEIIEFNHVGTPCDPISALPFSFTQSPQLFFLGYNDTEESEAARQIAVINHIYKIQTVLVVFSTLSFFLIVVLSIYVIMLMNKRRVYWCCSSVGQEEEMFTSYVLSGVDEDASHGEAGSDMDSPRVVEKEKKH